MWGFFVVDVCTTLIDLYMLIHPCELGRTPARLWCMTFLCAVGYSLLILCREFLHLYSSKILACNFLFWRYLWCGLSWWWQASYNVFGNVPSSLVFWKNFIRVLFMFGRICLWSHLLLDFCRELYIYICVYICRYISTYIHTHTYINYRFYFTSNALCFQIICFFLIQFWWDVCL